jgi:outer membrane protein OmpA-like peptidoglycan-associated protein
MVRVRLLAIRQLVSNLDHFHGRSRAMRASYTRQMPKLAFSTFLILAAFIFDCGLAQSQTAGVPDEASIVEALKSKGATRGVASSATADLLKALKDKSSRGISISQEERGKLADAVKDFPVQDMEIPFELNSADISPKAKPSLEALGHALQNAQLKRSSFLLAGHTDATGSAAYNQSLSERRAQTVRKVLIDEYHLTNEQVMAVGYGPERLKNANNPKSAENRRVQIVNIGD